MTGKEALKRLEKQYKRQNDHIKNSYERVSVVLPIGTKNRIKAQGETVNGLVNRLVLDWLTDRERKDYPKSLLDDISETEMPFK